MVKYIRYKIYLHTSRFPETGPNHIAWLKQILKQFWQKTIINAEHEQKQTQQLTEDWQETIMLNMNKNSRWPNFDLLCRTIPRSHSVCHFNMFLVHVVMWQVWPGFMSHYPSVTAESVLSSQNLWCSTKSSHQWQKMMVTYIKDFAKTLTISHRRQCGKSQGRSLSAYRRAHTRAQALFFKKIIMCTS